MFWLPPPTQILIDVSTIMRKFWYLLFGAGFGLFWGFKKWVNSEEGRKRWDAIKPGVHIHTAARRHDHDRVPVSRCYFLNQLVLSQW